MAGDLPAAFRDQGDCFGNEFAWFLPAMLSAMDYDQFYRTMVAAAHTKQLRRQRATQRAARLKK